MVTIGNVNKNNTSFPLLAYLRSFVKTKIIRIIINSITLLITVIASFAVVCSITIVKFSPKYQDAKIMIKNSKNVDSVAIKTDRKNRTKIFPL